MAPSAHLLRTLASVAPGTRVLDLAAGSGRHLVPLAQLGLDVRGATDQPEAAVSAMQTVVGREAAGQRVVAASAVASGFPSASADWVVLALSGGSRPAALAEAFRLLTPGGWVWVETDEAGGLEAEAEAAGLVPAEAASESDGRVTAIYRRPGAVA